jgi:hypothetical protein
METVPANTRTLYKNGLYLIHNNPDQNTDTGDVNSYISVGGLSGVPDFSLIGSIDEVRIWTALTNAQIFVSFNNGYFSSTNLVAYYRLNDYFNAISYSDWSEDTNPGSNFPLYSQSASPAYEGGDGLCIPVPLSCPNGKQDSGKK